MRVVGELEVREVLLGLAVLEGRGGQPVRLVRCVVVHREVLLRFPQGDLCLSFEYPKFNMTFFFPRLGSAAFQVHWIALDQGILNVSLICHQWSWLVFYSAFSGPKSAFRL